jgi:integrase
LRDYGERWRSNLRCHLYPVFGDRPMRAITLTSVLEWLTIRLADDTPKSSLRLYFELLDAVLAAAVTDRAIPENPCAGVKLAQVLRGLSRAPKWVPNEDEVLALLEVVPLRYLAALWLGAGQGCRLGEALGMEDGDRCVDSGREELHVVQQLRYAPQAYGGFYLSEPKAGSSGTIDLDPVVDAGARPGRAAPARSRWSALPGCPVRRPNDLDRVRVVWRLRITLETSVHWRPKRDRRRGRGGAPRCGRT